MGLRVYLHHVAVAVRQGDDDMAIVITNSLNGLYRNNIGEALALHGPWQHQEQE